MDYDLQLINIGKVYDNGTPAVMDVNLDVKRGEFVALLGPSGCGKTTTLRMIAGFESVTSGDLLIRGSRINDLPAERRPTSMIFQNYALFPHMTVRRNVGYGLEVKKLPKTERDAKVDHILEKFGLLDIAEQTTHRLSGGQRQRIALARGLVVEPQILLLDEPLGALDANLRKTIQAELKLLQRSLGITFVFVTHAQSEALTMSDRVVVMNQGRIEQNSTPYQLYTRPATPFVAQFIGTPQMNVMAAADLTQLGGIPDLAVPSNGFVGLRPENVSLLPAGQGQFQAKVELVEALGAETLIYVTTARGTQLVARQNTRTNLSLGANEIQIETVSFGKEKPRNQGHDEGSWSDNRRDELIYQGE